MKVTQLDGVLPSRDADFDDLKKEFYKERELSSYLDNARMKTAKQEGPYSSLQGATITPQPCWPIHFQTVRRKVGSEYAILPKRVEKSYQIETADWATEVTGTGTSKEKWRGIRLEGAASTSHLFSVVTSTYLVPFAVGYRYLAHLPAEIDGDEQDAEIEMRHDLTKYKDSKIGDWGGGTDPERNEKAIRDWTVKAQKIWEEIKTKKSKDMVTERLDYQDHYLSSQQPRSYRVVYTRSRSFYAGVIGPEGTTALKMPYTSAKLYTREGGQIMDTEFLPVEGVICDNKVHTVTVNSEEEAYWLMGLFNSEKFNNIVMSKAEGEPPGIYNIPVKVLNNKGIEYEPSKDNHLRMAELAMEVEEKMNKVVKKYIKENKSVNISNLDDTNASPEIPTMVSSAFTRRLDAEEERREMNEIALDIIDS